MRYKTLLSEIIACYIEFRKYRNEQFVNWHKAYTCEEFFKIRIPYFRILIPEHLVKILSAGARIRFENKPFHTPFGKPRNFCEYSTQKERSERHIVYRRIKEFKKRYQFFDNTVLF